MFALIVAIIGLAIGFVASPNPVVALICGGTFGAIAWALTGFKVGSAAPTAQISSETTKPFDQVNREPPAALAGSRFLVDGVGEMTPRVFGASFVQRAFPESQVIVDLLFGAGKPGTRLPIAQSIAASPLAARLFLTALQTASNLTYATRVLVVDSQTQKEVMEGVVAELMKLRKSDGALVGRDDVKMVLDLVGSFHDLIAADMSQHLESQHQSKTARTSPPKSTELLLSLLVSHYSGGGQASQMGIAKLKQQGFYDSSYSVATEVIDVAAHAARKALSAMNVNWTQG